MANRIAGKEVFTSGHLGSFHAGLRLFEKGEFRKSIVYNTSSPKGNDAHLRAIIQSKKKWKHKFFRRLRAAISVVRGRIWLNFRLIQALMYVIITCKYENGPIKNNREKVATPFSKL